LPALVEVSKTPLWQTLAAPHYAWGLLGAAIVLLSAMTRVSNASVVATFVAGRSDLGETLAEKAIKTRSGGTLGP
jgi:hypothetical protein